MSYIGDVTWIHVDQTVWQIAITGPNCAWFDGNAEMTANPHRCYFRSYWDRNEMMGRY